MEASCEDPERGWNGRGRVEIYLLPVLNVWALCWARSASFRELICISRTVFIRRYPGQIRRAWLALRSPRMKVNLPDHGREFT
jgi:hypothetical protein